MDWKEVKSLVAIGGLPTVGFMIGSLVHPEDMTGAGIGGLVGGSVGIALVLRRMYVIYKEIENGIF